MKNRLWAFMCLVPVDTARRVSGASLHLQESLTDSRHAGVKLNLAGSKSGQMTFSANLYSDKGL